MKPLKDRAPEGRINPKGIPCLYLAIERDTALSEVRPWIGSLISVGQFKTSRNLVLIDCSVKHAEGLIHHLRTREHTTEEKEAGVWAQIDGAFAAPVNPSDDLAAYVPTQIIGEFFKNDGYDGIVYKSAFGEEGYNVTLFDVDAARLINCFLYKAKSINIKYEDYGNPYFVTEKKK